MPHFESLKHFVLFTFIAFYTSVSVADTIERPPNQPQLTLVSAKRTLTINADLGVTHQNSDDSRYSTIRDSQELGKLEPANLRIGLTHALPQHMEYEIRGDGQVRLDDSFSPQRISVEGVSDVNISASTSSWDYSPQGGGAALVETSYDIELDSASVVTLSMNSLINLARDDNYTFSLVRLSGARPVTIWSDTTVIDENSNIQRNFSRKLELKPGTYRMSVTLRANSANNGSDGFAQNTQATVTLEINGETGLLLEK